MKCKYCGEEFEQNRKGRKREYCNKQECLKKAKNDIQKKWYAKKMKVLNGSKNRIIEQGTIKKVVYSSTDRAINYLENQDFSDIIEVARELGAVRFKIIEMIKKCSPEQSSFDKEDQIFLHKVESLARKEEVYVDEIVSIFTEEINSRENRRNIKDRKEMLQHLCQGIISNPSAYIAQYLKDRDNRIYKPKIKNIGGN